MSSRALRKAQREREEQERLKKLDLEAEVDENGDESVPVQPARKSAFAMLGEQEDENEDDDDQDENQEEEEQSHDVEVISIPKAPAKRKKKKKKAKSGAVTPDTRTEQLDEIDQALKLLSTNGHASQTGATVAGSNTQVEGANRLLAIDTAHLHAQNEMRRLFGRAAVEERDEEQPAPANMGGNRRQQRFMQQHMNRGQGAHGRGGGLAAMALKRNIFIQGKEDWPGASGGGLGMEIEEKRADGTVLYKFVHNRIYQDVQVQFEMAVETMDPEELLLLLRENPYHVSTLLQVSEIAKQRGQHAESGDLLERALFTFGRAVHSTFSKNLAAGRARLDFARPENREFWLASWRYMQNLSRRATWRTVYEWAKLLLSISPEDDPYAIWLVLDQYALRARQDLDYLNISRDAAFKDALVDSPNVPLSQALAEFRAGNKHKGKQALFKAVGQYPWIIARLMNELKIDSPPAVWAKEPRTEKEILDMELYATCAKDLWIPPEVSALLTEVASAIPPDTPSAPPDTGEIQQNTARHILLSDTPSLIALIPRHYTAALKSSSDPLSPPNSYPSYTADLPHTQRRSTRTVPHRDHEPEPDLDDATPAENLNELQSIYDFFTNMFPWFRDRVLGRGANDVDEPTDEQSQEQIQREIDESGISREIVSQRSRRMIELRQRLAEQGAFDFGGVAGMDAAGSENEDEEDDDEFHDLPDLETPPGEGAHHARVEDAEDEGD